ncbi:MAG: hypothetical protein RLZZ292_1944 [Bacteroidota bacterium]|jgi:hypothetical protein
MRNKELQQEYIDILKNGFELNQDGFPEWVGKGKMPFLYDKRFESFTIKSNEFSISARKLIWLLKTGKMPTNLLFIIDKDKPLIFENLFQRELPSGVQVDKKNNAYYVMFRKNKSNHYGGRFKVLNEAIQAANALRTKLDVGAV